MSSPRSTHLFELAQVMCKLDQGGGWLSAARQWMQSNVPRGDTLTWSSGELVSIPFLRLEELAKVAAAAAILEDRKSRSKQVITQGGNLPSATLIPSSAPVVPPTEDPYFAFRCGTYVDHESRYRE